MILRGLDVPIVLAALQPLAAMDYERASTYMQLCNDDFCSVPEFLGVAIRLGCRAPDLVLGTLEDDPVADTEIAEWCGIAEALHDLRRARLGHLGHVLEAMLDMHTDLLTSRNGFFCRVLNNAECAWENPGFIGCSNRSARHNPTAPKNSTVSLRRESRFLSSSFFCFRFIPCPGFWALISTFPWAGFPKTFSPIPTWRR